MRQIGQFRIFCAFARTRFIASCVSRLYTRIQKNRLLVPCTMLVLHLGSFDACKVKDARLSERTMGSVLTRRQIEQFRRKQKSHPRGDGNALFYIFQFSRILYFTHKSWVRILATPSLSTVSVTMSAQALTSPEALPMATPMPAWRSMGLSLPPSPNAMVSEIEKPK